MEKTELYQEWVGRVYDCLGNSVGLTQSDAQGVCDAHPGVLRRSFLLGQSPMNAARWVNRVSLGEDVSAVEVAPSNWTNDALQFPRFIAEAIASGAFSDEILLGMSESMGLSLDRLDELMARAERKFEYLKTAEGRAVLVAEESSVGVSINHLPKSDHEVLGQGLGVPRLLATGHQEALWLVDVTDADDEGVIENFRLTGLSDTFVGIVQWAFELGYACVTFDYYGEVLPNFPVLEF